MHTHGFTVPLLPVCQLYSGMAYLKSKQKYWQAIFCIFHRQVFRMFVCCQRPLLILTFNFPFKQHVLHPCKYGIREYVCIQLGIVITRLASTEVTVYFVISLPDRCRIFNCSQSYSQSKLCEHALHPNVVHKHKFDGMAQKGRKVIAGSLHESNPRREGPLA